MDWIQILEMISLVGFAFFFPGCTCCGDALEECTFCDGGEMAPEWEVVGMAFTDGNNCTECEDLVPSIEDGDGRIKLSNFFMREGGIPPTPESCEVDYYGVGNDVCGLAGFEPGVGLFLLVNSTDIELYLLADGGSGYAKWDAPNSSFDCNSSIELAYDAGYSASLDPGVCVNASTGTGGSVTVKPWVD